MVAKGACFFVDDVRQVADCWCGAVLLLQVLYRRIDIFVARCRILVLHLLVSRGGVLHFFRMRCLLWLKVLEITESQGGSIFVWLECFEFVE